MTPPSNVVIIGGNGAGQTTTLQTVAGLLRPRRGAIRGTRGGHSADRVARHGVALVPESRLIFADQTVLDNLRLRARACSFSTSRRSASPHDWRA